MAVWVTWMTDAGGAGRNVYLDRPAAQHQQAQQPLACAVEVQEKLALSLDVLSDCGALHQCTQVRVRRLRQPFHQPAHRHASLLCHRSPISRRRRQQTHASTASSKPVASSPTCSKECLRCAAPRGE